MDGVEPPAIHALQYDEVPARVRNGDPGFLRAAHRDGRHLLRSLVGETLGGGDVHARDALATEFPENRENNRECEDFRGIMAFGRVNSYSNFNMLHANSRWNGTGNFHLRTGNFPAEQEKQEIDRFDRFSPVPVVRRMG